MITLYCMITVLIFEIKQQLNEFAKYSFPTWFKSHPSGKCSWAWVSAGPASGSDAAP